MTTPARVPQADITRAFRAARNAGFASVRVRIDPDGTIDILAGTDAPDSPAGNPLDRVLHDAA